MPTLYFRDASRSIISSNTSPDVPFDRSVNPYRGCEHGCSYCYVRPTHEYLGLSAGLEFETRIFVKPRAPDLLRAELSRRSWTPQVLAMSGVTDPYQPIERRLQLTRGCLAVLAEFRNPVGVITKSALVTRDLDLLAELATHRCVSVTLSVTTLEEDVRRAMEPRASTAERRFEAITRLRDRGVPAGVNIAPVVPGLTDHEIVPILRQAAQAGAQFAHFIVLRLPYGVKDLFEAWLDAHVPRPEAEGSASDQGTARRESHHLGVWRADARHRGLGGDPRGHVSHGPQSGWHPIHEPTTLNRSVQDGHATARAVRTLRPVRRVRLRDA